MFKIIIILVTATAINANAFWDSIINEAKTVAEAAAVAGSVGALLEETNVAAEQVKNLKELEDQINKMNDQIYKLDGLSEDTKRLIKGPKFDSTSQLSANIRMGTQYIKSLKILLTTVGLVSPQAQIAINATQTNAHLSRVVENQNRQIMMEEKKNQDEEAEKIQNVTLMKKRYERMIGGSKRNK